MIRPKNVEARESHRIWLGFSDGAAGRGRTSRILRAAVSSPLGIRPGCFDSVRLGPGGSIAWGDDIELCPDALYMLQLTGKIDPAALSHPSRLTWTHPSAAGIFNAPQLSTSEAFMPRLPEVTRDQLSPDEQAIYDGIAARPRQRSRALRRAHAQPRRRRPRGPRRHLRALRDHRAEAAGWSSRSWLSRATGTPHYEWNGPRDPGQGLGRPPEEAIAAIRGPHRAGGPDGRRGAVREVRAWSC